jgi:hypothetical protein
MISSVLIFNSVAVPVAFTENTFDEIAVLGQALKEFSSGTNKNWVNNRYAFQPPFWFFLLTRWLVLIFCTWQETIMNIKN